MFLITVTLWAMLCGYIQPIVVRVEQGLLRGEVRDRSTGNGLYCSFKGIPYAAPPVGNLRFKAPQPPLCWRGERNATQHGSVCPQSEVGTGKYIPGNEDCLFLNVYTPTINPQVSLPVMFYIHGGDAVEGSGNDDVYGPDFLIDNDVVLVTINYRLGALGFLCLDIKDVPGNAGLKDQVAALQWVKRNIAQFGGDPNNITLFGEISVSYHSVSPMTKGLFNRGIISSSVFLDDGFAAFEPKEHSLLLAQQLGLYTKDPYKAYKFLQNASVKSLVTTVVNLRAVDILYEYVSKVHPFQPVIEKNFGGQHFLLEDPEKLLMSGQTNDVDLIIGHTEEEGITRAVADKDSIFKVYPYFKEVLVPTEISTARSPKEVFALADIIQNHYFGEKEISEKNMKEFIRFYSDYGYVYAIHRFLELWIKSGRKAYFYVFSCFSERNIYGLTGTKYGLRAAAHKDDFMYLFDGKKYNLPINKNRPSYKMIVQTCELFTNFAKYGNPTPVILSQYQSPSAVWVDYGKSQTALKIDLTLTQGPVPMNQVNFWRNIFNYAGLRFS